MIIHKDCHCEFRNQDEVIFKKNQLHRLQFYEDIEKEYKKGNQIKHKEMIFDIDTEKEKKLYWSF